MMEQTLSFMILVSDRLWQAGDMGMVRALDYRARGRGINIDWQVCHHGEALDLSGVSAVLTGGRTITDPGSIMDDMRRMKQTQLQLAIEEGMPLLAAGAGFALLCDTFESANGRTIDGLGVFDTVSHRPGPRSGNGDLILWAPWIEEEEDHVLSKVQPELAHLTTDDAARDELIIGFVRHGNRSANPGADQALGRIMYCSDRSRNQEFEGMKQGSLLGTHTQGSLLPLNPALTDWFLNRALSYLDREPLAPMDNKPEYKVRAEILARIIDEH